MNRDLRDSDAPAPHKKPKQKNAADSNSASTDLVTTVAVGKTVESTNDGGTSRRESAVSARERAAYLREGTIDQRDALAQARQQTADQRDDVAQGREQSVHLRETAAASREDILQESERLQAALQNHIATLRQANENLVIATLQTQSMAEEIQKAKDQMGHMAHHDFLTGLPNRILLEERLVQAISLAKRHGTKLAVLFIDLDRFKTINDSLGHAIGDALLRSVAQRLLGSVRSTDTVSRQGGDEFVALLSEVADESAVGVFADKMCKAVSSSYRLAEQELHIGATLGISMYPDDGQDAETLIRHADVAMYHGKKSGGNGYSFLSRK